MKSHHMLLMLCAACTSVQAGEFNYNYVQAAYVSSDTDVAGINIDGDGYFISGSFVLTDNLAISAGIEDYSYDFDISANAYGIGVDFHTPLSQTTDIVLGVGVVKGEVTIPGLGSDDDTGNTISAGIRQKFSEQAELELEVARVDLFDDATTSFSAAVVVNVTDTVGLGIGYQTSDDTDAISFGVRAYF